MSIINLSPEQEAPVQDKTLETIEQDTTDTKNVDSVDNTPEEKVVVMDGPLSKIYTQALNLAYANEAASASGQTDIKILFDDADNSESDKDLYVYCCDSSNIDTDDVIQGTDHLRLALDGRYKQTLVVMESHSNIKPVAALLEEYAFKNGTRVVFSRDLAIEMIQQLLA